MASTTESGKLGNASAIKQVLNAGSGPYSPQRLHPAFRNSAWKEVRLDIDRQTRPDIVGSITDLSAIPNGAFDAIWCSHNLEHLHTYEVPKALREFRRILKPDGFALISSPDLEAIAELVVEGRADSVAYVSAAGPITALDMLYGLSTAIEQGNVFMAHHTGFTADRLGQLLVDSEFIEGLAKRGSAFDVWGLGLMPQTNKDGLLHHLRANQLDLFPDT